MAGPSFIPLSTGNGFITRLLSPLPLPQAAEFHHVQQVKRRGEQQPGETFGTSIHSPTMWIDTDSKLDWIDNMNNVGIGLLQTQFSPEGGGMTCLHEDS
ncbi:hypothetical protein R1flu_002761 [Riccia fluitans]|uniref:Uncharacterized protein n=1 Tax=Riccia fluitans TaxID=41844 RepID=A0ABD1Y743_9MARC